MHHVLYFVNFMGIFGYCLGFVLCAEDNSEGEFCWTLVNIFPPQKTTIKDAHEIDKIKHMVHDHGQNKDQK